MNIDRRPNLQDSRQGTMDAFMNANGSTPASQRDDTSSVGSAKSSSKRLKKGSASSSSSFSLLDLANVSNSQTIQSTLDFSVFKNPNTASSMSSSSSTSHSSVHGNGNGNGNGMSKPMQYQPIHQHSSVKPTSSPMKQHQQQSAPLELMKSSHHHFQHHQHQQQQQRSSVNSMENYFSKKDVEQVSNLPARNGHHDVPNDNRNIKSVIPTSTAPNVVVSVPKDAMPLNFGSDQPKRPLSPATKARIESNKQAALERQRLKQQQQQQAVAMTNVGTSVHNISNNYNGNGNENGNGNSNGNNHQFMARSASIPSASIAMVVKSNEASHQQLSFTTATGSKLSIDADMSKTAHMTDNAVNRLASAHLPQHPQQQQQQQPQQYNNIGHNVFNSNTNISNVPIAKPKRSVD